MVNLRALSGRVVGGKIRASERSRRPLYDSGVIDLDQLTIEVGRSVPLFFEGAFSFYWRHSNWRHSNLKSVSLKPNFSHSGALVSGS